MSTPTLILFPMSLTNVFLRGTKQFLCCEEMQTAIYCNEHFLFQGCKHCDFDLSASECECEK
jgi:hypothetical protein